jgi:hypothetical protein
VSDMKRMSNGPGRLEFAPDRDGVTVWAWGRSNPSVRAEFSLSRSEAARVVELLCKNAGLPAPWTGQLP